METTLQAGLAEGSTALLLPARPGDPADEACLRLLGGDEPRRRAVVALTFDRSAEGFIDAWIDHVGDRPADMSIVDVGSGARSVGSTADGSPPSRTGPSRNVVRSVEDPGDRAAIRAHAEELLTEPAAPDATRLLYLDSLSHELQEAGPKAALGLLDDVSRLVRRAGCVGLVRVEPGAYSDHTLDAMANLVDVALGSDGRTGGEPWTIRSGRCAVDGSDGGGSAPSIDGLFELLSDRRRRLALHYLIEADGSMAPFDLATRIAGGEPASDDPSDDESLSRIYTGLVHVHLPKLEDYGVVSVGADGDAVRLREPVESLKPLLALTVTGDLHG